MRRRLSLGPVLCCLCALAMAVPSAAIVGTVVCPFGGGGDLTDRGIVVQSYPGTNLKSVELRYSASAGGIYKITLTVRRGSYDGPLVGAPASIYVSLPGGVSNFTTETFDFADAPVTPGDTLTLRQDVEGPGFVYFDTGTGSCSPGTVIETEGTTPPLDTERRVAVGIAILADDILTDCVPSDTVLCLDDGPGDHRFQATMSFSTTQSGGHSGDGQAIRTSTLGVNQGGLFWFFNQGNPEVLIKVLNACAINNRIWIFYSATTNVGFTMEVRDWSLSHNKFYTNPDIHAATPVQDTVALPCS